MVLSASAPHLTGEWFKALTDTAIVHVPYKGGPPVLTDLIGGHVQMAFGDIVNYLPQLRDGKLRALAVTSAKRTPQPIVDYLNHTLNKLLAAPALSRHLAFDGADPIGGTPRDFAECIQTELTRWAGVVRAAGGKPGLGIED